MEENIPGGGVELKGKDDVISVAYLTNEATLGAQVALEHVVGSVLQQCYQVGCILALCNLTKQTCNEIRQANI